MKKIFFTPGPSQLYPTVEKHIIKAINEDIPSISHRSKQFQKIFQDTSDQLRKLLRIPRDHYIFFTSSSLESMERVIENCVGYNSFHFVNGSFSNKFYEIALKLKKKAIKAGVLDSCGFDFNSIKIPKKIEVICMTQNETSTGVSIKTEDIYKIKKKYPEKIFAVDIVSSAPYLDIDLAKIDIAFFSVQKGFGLPAGLGVLIVNTTAIEKAMFLSKINSNIGSYHNFLSLLENAKKNQTTETPNVLYIYLLGKVCEDMSKYGIEKIRKQTKEKSDIIYNFFDNHTFYKPFVKDKKWRSNTTVVIETKNKSADILGKLSKKGYIIGSGYGKYKNDQIRIANFPSHKINDIRKMLEIFESLK